MAILAAAGGCGVGGGEFDSEPYCQLIADPGVRLDSKALIDGDKGELRQARSLYRKLRDKGPPELREQWNLIVRDLDSIAEAASGSVSAEEVDYEAFADAFAAIEEDKHDRCGG
jgi:hypothetical protein